MAKKRAVNIGQRGAMALAARRGEQGERGERGEQVASDATERNALTTKMEDILHELRTQFQRFVQVQQQLDEVARAVKSLEEKQDGFERKKVS